jgi:7-carboxy-7-deazaguanine synthase
MRVNEIFYSIQGEGLNAGKPTMFIRLQGCNLRCAWCDTRYAQDALSGKEMTIQEVLAEISDKMSGISCQHICITGGEPFMQRAELNKLIHHLQASSPEIETNGSYSIPYWEYNFCQHLSFIVDLKCPSSSMHEHFLPENLYGIRACDQLMAVIKDREDFNFAIKVIKEHNVKNRTNIFFQPAWGEMDNNELINWVKVEAPWARVSLQLHKVLWGNKKGV